MREDKRPTLASWPKRIFDWEELPAVFRPELEAWRSRGLPPGNVTYIPKVHQYKDGAEQATAWLGEEVLLLTAREEVGAERLFIRPGEVAQLRYRVRLLACDVEAVLDRDGGQVRGAFRYNKTKEDQLFPALNLLLGNRPEDRPRETHPSTAAMERLREDSFAMYHTAKLCYRFGDEIRAFLRFQGKNDGIMGFRKQKPEYFLGKMDRGVVAIRTDFYGSEAVYLPWERLGRAVVREAAFSGPGPRKRTALVLECACGEDVAFPLLPEQEQGAARFAEGLKAR